jgi:hypothetical protein
MSETNGAYETATTNGHDVAFDLSRLSYGDLRRLQKLNTTNGVTDDAQALVDEILEKSVLGGLDAIPLRGLRATVVALMAAIEQEMSGQGQPAAPSQTG